MLRAVAARAARRAEAVGRTAKIARPMAAAEPPTGRSAARAPVEAVAAAALVAEAARVSTAAPAKTAARAVLPERVAALDSTGLRSVLGAAWVKSRSGPITAVRFEPTARSGAGGATSTDSSVTVPASPSRY